MKVCFFGAYDKNFTSNKIILQGLKENNVSVLEVNSHVKVTRMDSKNSMNTWELVKRIGKKYKIFQEIIKHRNEIKTVDVIYVGYPGHFDVLLAYLVGKFYNKKVIFNPLIIFYTGFVEEQGILDKHSLLAKIIFQLEKGIYRLCDIVTPDTEFQKQHLQDDFSVPSEKLKVLPIGADDKTYVYAPKKDDGFFTVVYYGLYAPIHGTEYIMQAAAILTDNPKIRFLMIGNGQSYEKTKSLAEKLGLKNVIFYPDMTEENALQTLQQADVFLGFLADHPTVKRAIPNKVYQGLALGKAVVTAASPAISSLLTHKKNVYTVGPANSDDLAKAILELEKNKTLRAEIAHHGYELFKSFLTPKSIGKQLVTIIKQLEK